MKKDLDKNYANSMVDTTTSGSKGGATEQALFEDQKDADGPFRGSSIVVKGRNQKAPQSVLTENQQAFLKALNGKCTFLRSVRTLYL